MSTMPAKKKKCNGINYIVQVILNLRVAYEWKAIQITVMKLQTALTLSYSENYFHVFISL